MTPPLHPDLEPVAHLIGTWSGSGHGSYPTIESFDYLEDVEFSHVGKPFLAYVQRTRDAASGLPLHAESGYLRAVGPGRVELVVAQPSGIVEVHVGTVDGAVLSLVTVSVLTTPTAKDCTAVERRLTVHGDELGYELAMAAVGQPMTHHLAATLQRTG
ncbi:MAG: FABP family protein [Acidimicrobiales bacterium]|nr:FABP family protein [Acidimicrobiales bacterium]